MQRVDSNFIQQRDRKKPDILSVSLKDTMKLLFVWVDSRVLKTLENFTNEIEPRKPTFYPFLDYKKKTRLKLEEFHDTFKKLKEICFEVNLIQEYKKIYNQSEFDNQIALLKDLDILKRKRNRKIGRNDDLHDKCFICPYKGCPKSYAFKSSLNFHIKKSHKNHYTLKDNITNQHIFIANSTKRGVRLDKVFKYKDIERIKGWQQVDLKKAVHF